MPSDENDFEQLQFSHIVGGGEKWCSHFERLAFSHKVEHSLSIPSSNTTPLPGIYPKEMKTYKYTKIYIQIVIVALFITARN